MPPLILQAIRNLLLNMYRRLTKQIGMGTRSLKDDPVFADGVNKQPVWLNMAFSMVCVIAYKSMISMLSIKLFTICK